MLGRVPIMCGLALLVSACAFAEARVDAEMPAGNIVCERVEGNRVYVRQERRDSTTWWFYWAFRVRGAEGRTLTVHFVDGEPVGTRGPAVSTDGGLSWRWADTNFTARSFTYAFAPETDEVRFAFGMVYTQRDWERFIARHAGSPFLSRERLTVSRKGREVEQVRLGCLAEEPRYRVLVTARHHCCEMMASDVLEGLVDGVLADDEAGRWLRENVAFLVVPFVDKDGVEDGDQGKNRAPRDHNRDYDGTSVHAETAALRARVPAWACDHLDVALDLHCPYIRGAHNECVYQVGSPDAAVWAQQQQFGRLLEASTFNSLRYRQSDDLPYGKSWNTGANFAQGMSCTRWASGLPGVRLASSLEIPYATAGGAAVDAASARRFGRGVAAALRGYLETACGAAHAR